MQIYIPEWAISRAHANSNMKRYANMQPVALVTAEVCCQSKFERGSLRIRGRKRQGIPTTVFVAN